MRITWDPSVSQREFKIMESKTKEKAMQRVWSRLRQTTHKLARRETLLKSKVRDVKGAKPSPLPASAGHGVWPWQIGALKKRRQRGKKKRPWRIGVGAEEERQWENKKRNRGEKRNWRKRIKKKPVCLFDFHEKESGRKRGNKENQNLGMVRKAVGGFWKRFLCEFTS